MAWTIACRDAGESPADSRPDSPDDLDLCEKGYGTDISGIQSGNKLGRFKAVTHNDHAPVNEQISEITKSRE